VKAVDATTQRDARRSPDTIGPPMSGFQEVDVIEEKTLSAIEARLVAAVVENPMATQADLAVSVKVTERHVRRLLAREPVRRALNEAASAGVRETAAIIGRGAARAGRALVSMADGTVPATSARVAACRAALDFLVSLTEYAERKERMGEVERMFPGFP
jgi:hypothetical protein